MRSPVLYVPCRSLVKIGARRSNLEDSTVEFFMTNCTPGFVKDVRLYLDLSITIGILYYQIERFKIGIVEEAIMMLARIVIVSPSNHSIFNGMPQKGDKHNRTKHFA